MGAKATYDAVNKLITLTEAPSGGKVTVDVQVDLYSDGKEDWKTDATLGKFTFPWTAIGGQDTGESRLAGQLFFLRNDLGWRIRPYEQDHQVTFNENLFGASPSIDIINPTVGGYNVVAILNRSNLASTVESGTSGLTPTESTTLLKVVVLEQLLRNKVITNPTTGIMTVFDDAGGVLFTAPIYEDDSGIQPYRGQGIERRERLT